MIYVACQPVSGTAHVADPVAVAEVEWCDRATVTERVPQPLYPPVEAYLDSSLALQAACVVQPPAGRRHVWSHLMFYKSVSGHA